MKMFYLLKFTILLILNILFFNVNAQSLGLAYEYDAAGNRISRSVVSEPAMQAPRHGAPSSHQQGDVTVSPTVTTGHVTISTTADLTQNDYTWLIVDTMGRTISSGILASQSTSVNIPGHSGMYYLTVTGQDERHSFKIVKQ